jgi:maltose alpha-D-glucosyltransferase/alpha-amylase
MAAELERYFERPPPSNRSATEGADRSLIELSDGPVPGPLHDVIGLSLEMAAKLGQRTAELHMTLASATDPVFAPEPMGADELAALAAELTTQASRIFHEMKTFLPRLPDEVVETAALVLSLRRRLLDRFTPIGKADFETVKTRVHGDYHLGQVLVVKNDFVILDFEGEPARPLAERRAKQSPFRDVAGMLRSFSYAAHAGLAAYTSRHPDLAAQIEPWAPFWDRWTSAAFLSAYRATAAGASFLPSDRAHLQLLLDAFLLHKALYELHYEMNNRPSWVRIPLMGILNLIERR